ncbi:MAG: hypothetical protein K8I27_06470, partial [Planctomycetes bacterium]|nr:hypothetical protein [Planctomycetota bacterium]
MRHRDKETVTAALESWQRLRGKVESEGGDNYAKPVLVKFLDTGTFEVMERDIVEDEFYVLRKWKILRELDPAGKDLEQAIRDSKRSAPRQSTKSAPRADGSKQGNRRGGNRRRGKRTGRRGSRRGGR